MPQPDAAVAIVRARDPELSILLIRRSEREDDPWSGHWSLPGGRRDPTDADLLDTALRELSEECGIALDRRACDGTLSPSLARRQHGRFLLVAPFLFTLDQRVPTVLDPREAAGCAWVSLRLLCDRTLHHLRPVPGRPRDTLFPALDLDGPPLWGFTYRLITDWLELTSDAGFAAAQHVLAFILDRGLRLVRDWNHRVVRVAGTIPVDAVLARYAEPGPHVFSIQRLDVHQDRVCVAGPGFEEYVIEAVPGA